MTKEQLAADILESLVDCGCTTFPSEVYEEYRTAAIQAIEDRLNNYVVIEGRVIE